MAARVIARTAYSRLSIEEDPTHVVIEHYSWDGYGNSYAKTVRFNKNSNTITIRDCAYTVVNPRCITEVDFSLDPDDFSKLLAAAREIKNVDDFKKLVDAVIKLQDAVKEKIENAVEELYEKLYQLSYDAKILEIVRDKDKLLEILYEYVTDDC